MTTTPDIAVTSTGLRYPAGSTRIERFRWVDAGTATATVWLADGRLLATASGTDGVVVSEAARAAARELAHGGLVWVDGRIERRTS